MATNAGQIDIKLRAGFDKGAMNNATREVGKNMQLMSNRIKGAGSAFSSAVLTSVAPFGAAVVGAFALGGAAAVRFEEQFANVKKTLDIKQEGAEAERAFQSIALQLRALAKFSPAGIEELTQIAAVGGQLGIAASDIVKFTDTIQKLTVATNMSAEDAAMSLARLQKITNLAASEVDNLASVIVKLGNNFATTESEIVTAATQIATATAGISTDFNNAATDAVAFATALRAVGQPAQAGATAIIRLVQVVDRLVSVGGPRLALVADTANMTVEAFKGLFEVDPGKALAGFIEGLGVVEERGDDAVAILEEIGLGQIRTRRAIQALSRAEGADGGGLLSEALAMSNQEFLDNNALLTEAERRYETVASQIKILRNIVNESAITFGEKFLPLINNFVQGLANFLTLATDFEKVGKKFLAPVAAFTALGGALLGMRSAFDALTLDTLEYEAAISRLRTGVTSLTAEQEAMLFSRQARGMSLYTQAGFLGGMTMAEGGSRFSPRDQLDRFRTQQIKPDIDIPLGGDIVLAETTLATRTFNQGTIEATKSLRQLQKASGKNIITFLRQNKAFKDTGLFIENMEKNIENYNKTGKGTIQITERMRGGFMGLGMAIRTAAVAVKAFMRSLIIFGAISFTITKILSIFERLGAQKRSLDEFAQGLDSVTESVLELEQNKITLEKLFDLKATKEAEGAPQEVTDAIDDMIEQTEQAIARGVAGVETDAGGLLETLLFGQKGGKDLEDDIAKFAEDAGLDKENLEQKIFGGLSGVVTDIQSGSLPTIDELIADITSGGTGDAALDRNLEKLQETGQFLEILQSGARKTLIGLLDVDIRDSQIAQLDDALDMYEAIIEATTGQKIGALVSGQEISQSSKLLEAKGKFLNQQQELLVTQGLITEKQTLDATKQENYAKSVELVMDTIRNKTDDSSNSMENFEDTLEGIEMAFGDIAKTIDDNLQNSVNSAINSLEKLPEAARMTAQKFARNFKENIETAQLFEKLIRDLSQTTPLLAKQLSELGPTSMNVLKDLLANPALASDLEKQLSEVVGPELAEAAAKMLQDNKSDVEEAGEDFADGVVVGIENKKEEISQVFSGAVEDAVQRVLDDQDMGSPSENTRKLIGHALIDGIILGITDRQSNLNKQFVEAVRESVSQAQQDFAIFTDYKQAQRGVTSAAQARIQAEQSLNAERRNAASLQDRIIKNQKDLNRLEIEGAKGNITLNEEINILRKKISLEEKLKSAGGNKSARELLAIQKAEENIQDLRAMANKGVISNLELQAAEEDLAKMKGTDLSDDERKLVILELAQAEQELSDTKEKALDVDPRLISLREEDIKLRDELALSATNLKIAEENLQRAKEGVVKADQAYLDSAAKLEEAIAYDSGLVTRLTALDQTYSSLGLGIANTVTQTDILTNTMVTNAPIIADAATKIGNAVNGMFSNMSMYLATMFGVPGYDNAFMGSGEFNTFMGELERQRAGKPEDLSVTVPNQPFAHLTSGFYMLPDYIQEAFRQVSQYYLDQVPGYGMGGRIKKYKYGGRGDPMTRALVGEYGPEEVRFVPGNGFMVKPLGTGKSGTVVNNLNVNVTGVPSDPISARKAAVQISKALRKLDKEGSAGTGLRRN
tara:strand:+ start:768 stop:5606 length:4839 start_codon:yes stop_codon:yes gene_type:complete